MSKLDKIAARAITYRSHPTVLLWYLSAVVFFIGVGFIELFTPVSQAMLVIEMREFIPGIPIIWGTLGVLSFAAEMAGVATDNKYLTKAAATMYVILWFFAGGVYLTGGYIVLFMAVALPHLLFWAWNYAVRYDHARIVREVRGLIKQLTLR